MLSVVSVCLPGPNVSPNSPRYTNCATCDSRTMSCAPFLISLSSSGKRYDSVSRESSVHSMMSMNCFLRKSMMAISFCTLRALFLGPELLPFRFRVLELGLEPRRGQRAGHHASVGEHERRRCAHAVPGAELGGLRHGVVAIALVLGQRARFEIGVPRLQAIVRAPDHARLARGVGMQRVDRIQEGVDRYVVHTLELLLEPRAERAVGI